MEEGLVSVMMPAYNAARFIDEAIRSVVAQTYPQWELLVVNDGSTDDTARIASGFTDGRIRLIDKPNGGEASARNVALEHSRGEFIAYLDADDAWLPDHLSLTVAALQAAPDQDAVYTDGLYYDQDGNRGQPLSARRRGPFTGDLFAEVVRASDVFGPPICVVLRRASVTERQLRYDTRIVIGPDWDFFTRYAEHARFGYVDARTCLYRVHQTNITVQVDRRRRAGYLARCRQKAIHLARFAELAAATRVDVFYDLLINLLAAEPERQAAVLTWPQFQALPPPEQARLLRLMASKGMARGESSAHVSAWLERARQLNPDDAVAWRLARLYRFHPGLTRLLLRLRGRLQRAPEPFSPFGELV